MTDRSVSPMRDPLGAFMPGEFAIRAGAEHGPLKGLAFAAKDIFDVAGTVTGCGNKDWARTHAPATQDAPAVAALLAAGAELVGKTITDELAYSLNGQNYHYGTPANPNAPGRIPGGSSSGSASAVAGGIVDTALGSDTGGSVRLPASYCGLYGIRTTHGLVTLEGVMPLAPSFDTVGWFARDAETLRRVGEVLVPPPQSEPSPPGRLLIAEDAFAVLDAPVRECLEPWVERLKARFGGATKVSLGEPGGGLQEWMRLGRILQAHEIWRVHGDWIEATRPLFGPEIQERFDWVRTIAAEEAQAAVAPRAAFKARLNDLLGGDAIVCLPAAPDIAPRADETAENLLAHRSQIWKLTCPAGLAGLPQISLPLTTRDGCPLGLGLMGGAGMDLALLRFAEAFTGSADVVSPTFP